MPAFFGLFATLAGCCWGRAAKKVFSQEKATNQVDRHPGWPGQLSKGTLRQQGLAVFVTLASLTKQITAACILLLEERGKLRLSDTMDKYLPDYPPEQASAVTIEHLLTHTSGILNITRVSSHMSPAARRRDHSVAELIDLIKQTEPVFTPGEQWRYSNSGYILLGAIIEKVSGESYEEFVQENIFDRLGMKNSYYGSHTRIIPNRASGYEYSAGELANARFISMTRPYAAGALLSSVDDFAIWDQALFSGKVVSKESLERMTTKGKLNNGQEFDYGYGLAVVEWNGHKVIQHSGAIMGFLTSTLHVVDENLFVAVFTNSLNRQRDPGRTAWSIAGLILKK